MPKIIDCSIGFNETDMLRIRRAELASVVDAFVVVEFGKIVRRRTQSNSPLWPAEI